MYPSKLLEDYAAGPQLLKRAVSNMTPEQIDAAPIPNQWSTRQVICHIADFEPVYVDRITRVLVEKRPTFFGGDPDQFAAKLHYQQRNLEHELQFIEVTRRHLLGILRQANQADFQRVGLHSEAGPMTVEQLLSNISGHIQHHVKFIDQKRQALQ